jgi:hypothetical protein
MAGGKPLKCCTLELTDVYDKMIASRYHGRISSAWKLIIQPLVSSRKTLIAGVC